MTIPKTGLDKLATVNPILQKLVMRAAEISAQPFTIVQGRRTLSEQKRLYAQGRTSPGPKVTWTMKSKHLSGVAIDFAALVDGKISWNDKLYPTIALAFHLASIELGIPIVWGGQWHNPDLGHIELQQ